MTPLSISDVEISVVRSALKKQYEILEELGRGGMAVVYRARERALDREVAIKVLPAALTLDAEFVERFQREARTAGQLEHPNIVPIYRVGQSGRVIYFVMKLLRGQSLATILRIRTKLTVDEVRHILLDTASALGYAAKRGVVHRDIKPDNVLLDHDGRCVVTDFGIAKTPIGPRTAAGTSMGTPRYMSPEHAQGRAVDGRSDMYSLGVVAYQCLTGVLPFDGEDPFAVLYKHINSPLPQPDLATDEERSLYSVIERMLAKNPEDRFQSADELIVALGGHAPPSTLVATHAPVRHSRLTPTEIMTTPITVQAWRYLPTSWRFWTLAAAVALLTITPYFMKSPDAAGRDTMLAAATAAPELPAVVIMAERPPEESEVDVATRATSGDRPTRTNASRPQTVAAARPTRSADASSRCPRTAGSAAGSGSALLLDSVPPQRLDARLQVTYDVCGLERGSAYSVDITVRRLGEAKWRYVLGATVRPVKARFADTASSARPRRTRTINLAGLSSGPYALDVVINHARDRRLQATREFEILNQ